MKKTLPTGVAAAALLLPAGLLAQMTGTSHPEDLKDTISTAPTAHYVKPSPAVPVDAPAPAASAPASFTAPAEPVLKERVAPPPSASAELTAPARTTARTAYPASHPAAFDDPNSGVVLEVPSAPNELPAGTLVHASLSAEISTVTTQRGDAFTARLLQPLKRKDVVLVPAGSVLTGRVAEVHAGSRMHGGPAIHLILEYVVLLDGARHHLEAQVIDLPYVPDAKVSDEGTIRGKDHIKENAAGLGVATGGGAMAGALVGGGVGAAVGATIGAGVGTVWWLRHEQEQTLRANTEIVFSLDRPLLLGVLHGPVSSEY